jgi:hypothetical protein
MDEDRALIVSEPCPYIPGETSTAEVFKADGGLDRYEELIPQGWRRSGSLLYRYRCAGCARCIPIRLPASRIQGGKRLSRLLSVNSDLSLRLLPSKFRDEHFRLYEKYCKARHPETDFSGEEGYRDMIGSPLTAITEYRDATDRLCGAGIVDILPSGLSSVYFIFDPDEGAKPGILFGFHRGFPCHEDGKTLLLSGILGPRGSQDGIQGRFSSSPGRCRPEGWRGYRSGESLLDGIPWKKPSPCLAFGGIAALTVNPYHGTVANITV